MGLKTFVLPAIQDGEQWLPIGRNMHRHQQRGWPMNWLMSHILGTPTIWENALAQHIESGTTNRTCHNAIQLNTFCFDRAFGGISMRHFAQIDYKIT